MHLPRTKLLRIRTWKVGFRQFSNDPSGKQWFFKMQRPEPQRRRKAWANLYKDKSTHSLMSKDWCEAHMDGLGLKQQWAVEARPCPHQGEISTSPGMETMLLQWCNTQAFLYQVAVHTTCDLQESRWGSHARAKQPSILHLGQVCTFCNAQNSS